MATIIGKDQSIMKRIICKSCASILEYNIIEEKRDYTSDYLGDRDYYSYIICPCCAKQVVTKNY